MTSKDIGNFQKFIQKFYQLHGRSFPWRETRDPYFIFVSELMLQQTQTDRVVPKYIEFIKRFPTVAYLADSTLPQVFALWQGLGYNRRAKFLLETAKIIQQEYSGKFPQSENELRKLPGIGPYTAAAILAFSFNVPVVFIETNIRSVFIYHFIEQKMEINDTQLIPFIRQTLNTKNVREWYYGLMDYGAYLKKVFPNPNRKSKHYAQQSRFEGSNRQVRGLILRLLLQSTLQKDQLINQIPRKRSLSEAIIKDLLSEGLIKQKKDLLVLAD